jgi:hypothetical protein
LGQPLEGLEATKGIGVGRRWTPAALIGAVEPHDHLKLPIHPDKVHCSDCVVMVDKPLPVWGKKLKPACNKVVQPFGVKKGQQKESKKRAKWSLIVKTRSQIVPPHVPKPRLEARP